MGNCVAADFAEKFCCFSRDFRVCFSFLFFIFFFGGRVLCLGSTAGILDGYCQFGLDYC